MANEDLVMQFMKDINELRAEIKRLSVNQPIYDIANENTPTQLAADQDDYSIGNYDTLRMSSSSGVSISGMDGGVKGRFLRIFNVGSYPILLLHENSSSSAANRFHFEDGVSARIDPDASLTIYYDSTSSRWRDGCNLFPGAVGDGTTDDTDALQAMIDSGFCFIPCTDSFYKITQPLIVPSCCTIISNGAHIKNTATSAPSGWGGASGYWDNVFSVGNYGGETSDTYGPLWVLTFYGVAATSMGEVEITFDNAGDLANFSVGDIVFIRSGATFADLIDGKSIPLYVMTNQVVAVGASSITVKYPLNHDFDATSSIATAAETFTGLDGNTSYIAENVYIRGLKLESVHSNNWSVIHLSCFHTYLDDLELIGTSSGLGANPCAFSEMTNIRVNGISVAKVAATDPCINPVFEIAHLSNNVHLQNITVQRGQISFNECGSFVTMDGFWLGDGYVYIGRKYRVSVVNGSVINSCDNAALAAVAFANSDGNVAENVYVGNAVNNGIRIDDNTDACRIINCEAQSVGGGYFGFIVEVGATNSIVEHNVGTVGP